MTKYSGKKYDPTWLIELAKKTMPNEAWLHEALKQCNIIHSCTTAYIYFINPVEPNKPNSEWQFKKSIAFQNSEEGELVLDILRNGKVGGIEFINKIH